MMQNPCGVGLGLNLICNLFNPRLSQLHWLPVKYRCMFKTATLVYKFLHSGFLPIFNHSCHSAVVPIVPGVVTQIINTLLFLLSAHQSSSQSNSLITALRLMLLRSGMNSLMMCAVQHQLPLSERSLKHTCLQKHIPHSLSCHPVSPWYDLAMSSD